MWKHACAVSGRSILGATTWGVVRALEAAGGAGTAEATWIDSDARALEVASAIARAREGKGTIAVRAKTLHRAVGAVGPFDDLSRFALVLVGQVLRELDVGAPEDVRVARGPRGIAGYAERYEDEPARSVEQVMDQLASLDLVVASRFHNVLLALMLGKPVVSVSYNEKNDALMSQMGMEEYCRSIESFDLDWLVERVENIERNGARLRPHIAEKAAQFRDELEKQYAVLFGSDASK